MYSLVEHCDFADKNERIRDRIIAGMKDRHMSKQIQLLALDSDVTLDVVVQMLRNHELVHYPGMNNADVNRVTSRARPVRVKQQEPTRQQDPVKQQGLARRQPPGRQQGAMKQLHRGGRQDPVRSRGPQHSTTTTCRYCGRRRHSNPQQCPALGRTCFKCGGPDHFATVCQQVQTVEFNSDSPTSEEGFFLGAVKAAQTGAEWAISADVDQNLIKFKVDSGADVNVLSLQQYQQMSPKPVLQPASRQLSSVGGTLKVVGVFKGTIKYKKVSL